MGRGPAITQADIINVAAVKAIDPLMPDARVAEIIGRSRTAVVRIAERFAGVIGEYRSLKERDIIEDVDCVRRALLAHAAEPTTIEKMSGLQALTGFGILTDKLLLESGRPTSITLNAHADIQIPDVLGRLQRAIEGRQGAQATISGRQGVSDDDVSTR